MGIVSRLFKEKRKKDIKGVLWLDPHIKEGKPARVMSISEMAKRKTKKVM